jgi:integrase/recombinase XerD
MSKTVPDPEEASEAIRNYLLERSGLSKSTFKNHKSVLKRFETWLESERDTEILDAEPKDVTSWLRELHDDGDGLKGSTLRGYHQALRSFYDEYEGKSDDDKVTMLEGEIDRNPANFTLTDYIDTTTKAEKQKYADNNEGVIYLSAEEVRQIRRHVPDPKVRNELVVKMLVQTGLRRGELAEIKIEYLDREEGTVTVPAEVSKTDEKRRVPYDSLEPELSLWLDSGHRDHRITAEDSPYLFLTNQTKKLSGPRISSIVREAADAAGLDDEYMEDAKGNARRRVTAHSLRSTFIMRLLEAGIPTPKVMQLSGHDNLETVEKYANVLQSDAIDAYNNAEIDFGTD